MALVATIYDYELNNMEDDPRPEHVASLVAEVKRLREENERVQSEAEDTLCTVRDALNSDLRGAQEELAKAECRIAELEGKG